MEPTRVHFLGICGYAVSGAALLAREMGYTVSGADEDAYPPTTDILTKAGIEWVGSHSAENLDRFRPELVVVGNQIASDNVELHAVTDRSIPYLSEMEFYRQMTKDRPRLAVCGSHGKTTTASLLATVLRHADRDPGWRLGATPVNLPGSAFLGTGPFVFEGDEYRTSAFDHRAKFMHIDPDLVILTNIEYDHPDIYPSRDDYDKAFAELLAGLRQGAVVVAWSEDVTSMRLTHEWGGRLIPVGDGADAAWKMLSRKEADHGQQLTFSTPEGTTHEMMIPLWGEHNARNALEVVAAASDLGVDLDVAIAGVRTFSGVARRFEVVAEGNGIIVVDDYAHHPTKVRATLAAARERWPWHRITALFVPHTYSRTEVLLDEYAASFGDADTVLVAPVEAARERATAATVDNRSLVEALRARGLAAATVDSPKDAITKIAAVVGDKDVVLCMSVRGFDGVARQVGERLAGSRRG